MQTHKNHWRLALGSLGLLSLILYVPQAQAATEISESIYTTIGMISGLVISVLQFLSFIAFHILERLLDPKIVFDLVTFGGEAASGGGQELLLNVWRVSRDIMNVVFAILLVAGAIVTVVTANSEIIKQYYKKFILAVVLVNFSWFFPRVILDFANVLTATIYKLPEITDISTNCQYRDPDTKELVDCFIASEPKFFTSGKELAAIGEDVNDYTCPIEGDPSKKADDVKLIYCYKKQPFSTADGPSSVLNGLVMGHAGLPFLSLVDKDSPGPAAGPLTKDKFAEIFAFLVKSIFVVILYIMLFFPLAAMTVAFIVRILTLWVTIAFMPFMFAGFVIGDKMGSFNSMEIFKKFIKSAFLPAIVAVPLAVGYIMINNAMEITNIPVELSDPSSFVPTVSNLWQLLWLFASFAIIWVGFFMAIKIDQMYEKIGGFFQNIGQQWGKFALQAPLALPLPIMPGGASSPLVPLSGIGTALRDPTIFLRDKKLDGGDITNMMGGFRDVPKRPSAVEAVSKKIYNDVTLNNSVKNNIEAVRKGTDDKKVKDAVEKWIDTTKKELNTETGEDASRADVLATMKKTAELLGQELKDEDIKKINDGMDSKGM